MIKNLWVSGVLVLITTPAYADNFYMAFDYGTVGIINDSRGSADYSSPSLFRIAAGGRFDSGLGFELGEMMLNDDLVISAPQTATSGGGSAAMSIHVKQMQAVATYPVSRSLDVFGKAGFASIGYSTKGTGGTLAGWNTNNFSSSSVNFAYGVGAQLNLNEDIGIRGQYEDFGKMDVVNWNVRVTVVTLGVVYNF